MLDKESSTMENPIEETAPRVRKPYAKPAVHSEQMFETNALACGKCVSGPVSQFQCGGLLMNS
jgi:hypothetical protein